MKRKPLSQIYWLFAWLIMLGSNISYGEMAKAMTLIEAGDLFVTPELLMGKQVGVSGGGVLCLDQNHCVVENPLSPTLFIKLDIHLMKSEDKNRLVKECYQLLCSEFFIGSLTHHGFQATRSYASQHLLSSQTYESSSSPVWDLSKWRGMLLRRSV